MSLSAGAVFDVAIASTLNSALEPYHGGPHGGLALTPLQVAGIVFVCAGILLGGPVALVCGCITCVTHRSPRPGNGLPLCCGVLAVVTGWAGWMAVVAGVVFLRGL